MGGKQRWAARGAGLCWQSWFWLSLIGPTLHRTIVGVSADASDDWWQRTVFYQIYPRSFMDSNNDGVGDLRGITDRLEHLKDAGIGATWLSPIFLSPMVDFGYDITDYTAIQPEYGTMQDFEALMGEAKRLGIKIILDFVPNHTSDQCDWFRRSVAREAPYTDYYVWHDGREDVTNNGGNGTQRRLPPNNWPSVFYGSAWTFHPERGQYYLHQFTAQQPDLNFRNPAVVEEMREVLRFWLRKGVAGFRIDAVNHLFETEGFPDEPESGTDPDPLSYGFTNHIYTKDLLECYDMVYQWRELLDDWTREHGGASRIMMTEAYANITFTMKYYRSEQEPPRQGSHMPFNFLLITQLSQDSTAPDFVHTINEWLTYMPRTGATANWVLGNHDQPRVGTRYGAERIDALNTLLMTLPGIAVTYYGEEIGMVNNPDAISAGVGGEPLALDTGKSFIAFSRDPERTPFQWNDTVNAGFCSGSVAPWLPVHPNYRQLNLAAQRRAERSHYKTYQGLVRLRAHETFRRGSIHLLPYSNDIIAYTRVLPGSDTFVVVINLAATARTIDLLSVFPSIAPELQVASSGSNSSYPTGAIVQSDGLAVDGYDGLVLRSVPLSSRKNKSSVPESLWAAAKDAAIVASLVIALGTSFYHFQYCTRPWEGAKWTGGLKK